MTRSEQAQKAASEWIEKYGAAGEHQISLDCIQEVAFEGGVNWADSNPDVQITSTIKVKDAVQILHDRYIKGDKKREASLAVEREQGLKDGLLVMYSEYDKKCTELEKYKSTCDVMVNALEEITFGYDETWQGKIGRKAITEVKKIMEGT